MMHGESLLVWASVPWRSLRTSYDLGLWSNGGKLSIIRWGKSKIRRALRHDLIGHWYTTNQIAEIARQNSLCARFHGSITHPYRFHAVLRADESPSALI